MPDYERYEKKTNKTKEAKNKHHTKNQTMKQNHLF